MLPSLTPLLPLFLLLANCVCIKSSAISEYVPSLSGVDYESAYKQLGAYLSKELPGNEDASANVEKAKQWLDSDLRKGTDAVLTKAVELFTSLDRVLGDDKCSKEHLDILMANDQATGGRNRAVEDINVLKTRSKLRVDRIVDHYATKHSEACQDEYRFRYDSKSAQMNSEQLKRVQELLDQVIVMSYFHKSRVYGIKRLNRLYNDIIMQPDPIKGADSARAFYIVLGDLTEHQPEESQYLTRVLDRVTGEKSVHPDKIRDLFVKYLVKPCQYYVEELGANIFIPAKIEARWYHEIKESEHDYYYGWARYRFCESFLKSNHESILKGIEKLAEASS